jgi:hypothetical protein
MEKMVYEIKLDKLEDAKNLNDAALNYNGKLMVSCGSTMVDAKSILALFALIGRKNVKLVAPDHESPEKLSNFVKRLFN